MFNDEDIMKILTNLSKDQPNNTFMQNANDFPFHQTSMKL